MLDSKNQVAQVKTKLIRTKSVCWFERVTLVKYKIGFFRHTIYNNAIQDGNNFSMISRPKRKQGHTSEAILRLRYFSPSMNGFEVQVAAQVKVTIAN